MAPSRHMPCFNPTSIDADTQFIRDEFTSYFAPNYECYFAGVTQKKSDARQQRSVCVWEVYIREKKNDEDLLLAPKPVKLIDAAEVTRIISDSKSFHPPGASLLCGTRYCASQVMHGIKLEYAVIRCQCIADFRYSSTQFPKSAGQLSYSQIKFVVKNIVAVARVYMEGDIAYLVDQLVAFDANMNEIHLIYDNREEKVRSIEEAVNQMKLLMVKQDLAPGKFRLYE